MALPIWAHARGKLYDTVVMQDGRETWLGFHESLSSGEPYYCRPLAPRRSTSTPSPARRAFTSAKGKLDSSTNSYYPPRNDLTTFINGDCDVLGGVLSRVHGQRDELRDAQRSRRGRGGDAGLRRAVHGHVDNPDDASRRRLRAARRGEQGVRQQRRRTPTRRTTDPQLSGYGLTNNFGQPSVVYRVPIHIDVAAGAAPRRPRRRSTATATGRASSGAIIARDATISTADPGSGEARLLEIATAAGTGRVHVQRASPADRRPRARRRRPRPAPCPRSRPPTDGLTDTSAVVTFKHAQAERRRAVASYEIRYREGGSMTDQEFLEAIRAPLVAPGRAGDVAATFTLSGLKPATDYVAGRARGGRVRADLARRELPFATPATAVQAGRGLFRRDRRLGLGAGLAGRGAAARARSPAAGERHGRDGDRPLLPVGAPAAAACFAAATPPVPRSGGYFRRSRTAAEVSFSAIIRPLMSRARSLLLLLSWSMARRATARAPPTNARSSSTSRRPSARRSRSGSRSADGTFLCTVGLTQAVSVRGIGNRPGATQMNSGYHWPYGRREGVLPIWAHRRAAAPGAVQFPRVIFQQPPEGYASRTCEDSTRDSYFCLSFTAESTRKDALDAVSCASVFNSDKGRIMTADDVTAATRSRR